MEGGGDDEVLLIIFFILTSLAPQKSSGIMLTNILIISLVIVADKRYVFWIDKGRKIPQLLYKYIVFFLDSFVAAPA